MTAHVSLVIWSEMGNSVIPSEKTGAQACGWCDTYYVFYICICKITFFIYRPNIILIYHLYITGGHNDTFIIKSVYVEHDYYIIEWVWINKYLLQTFGMPKRISDHNFIMCRGFPLIVFRVQKKVFIDQRVIQKYCRKFPSNKNSTSSFPAIGESFTYTDTNVSAVILFKAIDYPLLLSSEFSATRERYLIIKTWLKDMLVDPALWRNWETLKK